MKRLLLFVVLVCLLSLLGCSGNGGNGIVPPPPVLPVEPPLGLIQEYTDRFSTVRWSDGVVFVYDAPNLMEEVLKEVNEIIGGPVVFKTTPVADKAQVVVSFSEEEFSVHCFIFDGLTISAAEIHLLNNGELISATLIACGISEEKAKEGFSDNVKEVLYWLYRLEPGTLLF
jgi:hypothetical protein